MKLLPVFLLLWGAAFAQVRPPEVLWTKEYVLEKGTVYLGFARPAPDGGFLLVGREERKHQDDFYRYFFWRFDDSGNPVWGKHAKEQDHMWSGYSAMTATKRGYLFVKYEGELVFFDLNGDTLWHKELHVPILKTSGTPLFLAETPDGGFIVGASSPHFDEDNLFRLNEQGDTLWTKYFDDFHLEAVFQAPGGSFVICGGLTVGNQRHNPLNRWLGNLYGFRLIGLSEAGEILWDKRVRKWTNFRGISFAMSTGGEIFVSIPKKKFTRLERRSPTGKLLWRKRSRSIWEVRHFDLMTPPGAGVFAVGKSDSDEPAFRLDLIDKEGKIVEQKSYKTPDAYYLLTPVPNGGGFLLSAIINDASQPKLRLIRYGP